MRVMDSVLNCCLSRGRADGSYKLKVGVRVEFEKITISRLKNCVSTDLQTKACPAINVRISSTSFLCC